ncbi:hypothetical protein C8R44DRAFT_866895 [Mycena epipterygia]|nr:hypothetical protein C8R44DRAFT_866895 [Mycena epipterygia]
MPADPPPSVVYEPKSLHDGFVPCSIEAYPPDDPHQFKGFEAHAVNKNTKFYLLFAGTHPALYLNKRGLTQAWRKNRGTYEEYDNLAELDARLGIFCRETKCQKPHIKVSATKKLPEVTAMQRAQPSEGLFRSFQTTTAPSASAPKKVLAVAVKSEPAAGVFGAFSTHTAPSQKRPNPNDPGVEQRKPKRPRKTGHDHDSCDDDCIYDESSDEESSSGPRPLPSWVYEQVNKKDWLGDTWWLQGSDAFAFVTRDKNVVRSDTAAQKVLFMRSSFYDILECARKVYRWSPHDTIFCVNCVNGMLTCNWREAERLYIQEERRNARIFLTPTYKVADAQVYYLRSWRFTP